MIKLIKTEDDYQLALNRLEQIFDSKIGTMESDEADLLALLIDEYEKKYYPIDAPDPIDAIKIRMEEMDLKQVDLISAIGGKSRVSEILNKKRKKNKYVFFRNATLFEKQTYNKPQKFSSKFFV